MNTTTNPLQKYSFYTLLFFIITGMAGAGFFYTRSFLLLSAVLYLLIAIYGVVVKKLRLLPVHLGLLLLTAVYWLSVLHAVDMEQAVLEAAKVSLLLPVSLFYSALSRIQRGRLWAVWAWGGAGLTLWGLLFGLVRDGRLESTLGYANVFAVVTAAGLAAAWQVYRQSGRKVYILPAGIQLLGLLLSGSRAVLILSTAGAVLLLLMNVKHKRLVWGITAAMAILLAAITAGIVFGSNGLLRSISWNAPEFALRRVYWSDGLSLWQKHWLTGIGGGGWAVMYPSVFVKYVHQQYLQVALDTGIAGLLVFIAMILSALRAGLRRGREGWGSVLALVLFCAHLAFDIDFAYPLVAGLLIMLLTEMEAEGYKGREIRRSGLLSVVTTLISSLMLFGMAWTAAGYIEMAKGEAAMHRGDWERALHNLHLAERVLPWSHEVHYQLAAAYFGQAQAYREENIMAKAVEEIRAAASMVPENKRYQAMLKKAGQPPAGSVQTP